MPNTPERRYCNDSHVLLLRKPAKIEKVHKNKKKVVKSTRKIWRESLALKLEV